LIMEKIHERRFNPRVGKFRFPKYRFRGSEDPRAKEKHSDEKYLKSLPKEINELIKDKEEFIFRLIGFASEGVLESTSTRLAFIIDGRDLDAFWERLETDIPGKKS